MKYYKIVSFLVGVWLFMLNIYGLFISLRNPDIYNEKNTYFKNDIIYSEIELLDILRKGDENNEEFCIKSTEAIHNGIAHYWKEEGAEKYNMVIPVYENYILFILGHLFPGKLKYHEFYNYKKAIERGIGLCSQHAIILSQVLENNGIETKILGLKSHVVVTAEVNGEKNVWWVLDPDFGVIFKMGMEDLRASPEILEFHYINKTPDSETLLKLHESFTGEVMVFEGAEEYSGIKRVMLEQGSYLVKWVLPFLFIMPITFSSIKKRYFR